MAHFRGYISPFPFLLVPLGPVSRPKLTLYPYNLYPEDGGCFPYEMYVNFYEIT
jgi:hypothetical protein